MSRHRSKTLRTYVLAAMASVILIPAGDAFGYLDIQSISFMEGKYWWDGTLEEDPFGLWVGVSGEGITGVTVTTPGSTPIVLVLDYWGGGGADWGFDVSDYATLGELRADFPTGYYVFSFNGGADSVTLYRGPVKPTGFANITYPNDGAINVPLNPIITWDSCVGFGDALCLLLWDEVDNTGIVTGSLDIGLTNWTPPSPLAPGHLHELEIAVFDGRSRQPYSKTTENSDDFFFYYDLFEYCNTILFATFDPTVIPVEIDIKPGSCPNPLNIKSKGVLPVAILGTENFDVSPIDAASIRLAGVAPIHSSFEDVATPMSDGADECECTTEGPDGYVDLTLKFDTQEIVDSLGEVDDGDILLLTLTGLLFDEMPIEGADCVVIKSKEDKGKDEGKGEGKGKNKGKDKGKGKGKK